MGGKHCCVVGCGANNARHKGLSFHKIPTKGSMSDEWRRQLIAAISRADKGFNPDKAHICSRHFEDDCFEKYGTSKRLVPSSLPTKFMTLKSIPATIIAQRKPPLVRPPPEIPQRVAYFNLDEVKQNTVKLMCEKPMWYFQMNAENVFCKMIDGNAEKICLTITKNLRNNVIIKGRAYTYPENAAETLGLKTVLTELEGVKLCSGVTNTELQKYAHFKCDQKDTEKYFRETVTTLTCGESKLESAVFSNACLQAVNSSELCRQCAEVRTLLMRKHNRATSKAPIHIFTPLNKIEPNKMISLLKETRKENRNLQAQLQKKLADEAILIDAGTHASLYDVMCGSTIENNFVKLFWEEQKKAFVTNDRGMRWHPMLLRFAIMLHSYSPTAYSILRETGVLKLPGESTLRDYTNVIRPESDIQYEALDELKKQASRLEEHNKYVVISHDEMQVKADLVFDKRGETIIGFIDRDKWTFNEDDVTNSIATHVLVFFVVGISSRIKSSIAYYGTKGTTARDIYPKFWTAVAWLETYCKLKVLISCSDKAGCNLSFYKMHDKKENTICYKTVNKYASSRYIYFVSDPPHLLKTFRNILEKSRANGACLWFDGNVIAWDHVLDVWKMDHGKELYRSKLTIDHVHLTPRSRMSVDLAAKVMSESTARILEAYFPPTHQLTAKFILLVDQFFDCLNTRNLNEADRKRKPNLHAYQSYDDPRFEFLEGPFLQFFRDWKLSVESRPGPFEPAHRKKMFISDQTYLGVQMTVHSLVESARFLLDNGVQFVLANRYCQDSLEEHFGQHRGMGRRSENPSLYVFGYQENKIRLQRTLVEHFKPKGNTRKSQQAKKSNNIEISLSPIKKKVKKTGND